MVRDPAIVILGPSAVTTAERLAAALPGAEIHGQAARVTSAAVAFEQAPSHLGALFLEGRPIIGVCATGILIRALAPVLADKRAEPPVIAVAEDGSAVVPLLGGHKGANALARRIAEVFGVRAAVTTAGDLRFGLALDEPPEGWSLANPQDAKAFAASLLAGQAVRLDGCAKWLSDSGLPLEASGGLVLRVTEKAEQGSSERLVYHPRRLAVGVGCERGCSPEELEDLVHSALERHGLARQAVALVASLDLKEDEAAVESLAERLAVPARFFSVAELNAEAGRLANASDLVLAEVGCPGVAEGAALAAAGSEGALIVEKTKSSRATCAIALSPEPINPTGAGRLRGQLFVVGIGPGTEDWRSPEASGALRRASDWVGYGLYLDLAAGASSGATRHAFALGEEEARVRHALALAAEGRSVALVCSGDAGIYAMASLVYEVMDQGNLGAAERRVAVTVVPGISAFQAAAARAGAPIGHDFCAISLSDLLTPWEVIERRLRAAAEGDFVVALYNPRSRKRVDHLARALEILSGHRPPGTPVILATNLGRADERLHVAELSNFDPEEVDMLTVVMVGASQSRVLRLGDGKDRVYTPRGYAAKREGQS